MFVEVTLYFDQYGRNHLHGFTTPMQIYMNVAMKIQVQISVIWKLCGLQTSRIAWFGRGWRNTSHGDIISLMLFRSL